MQQVQLKVTTFFFFPSTSLHTLSLDDVAPLAGLVSDSIDHSAGQARRACQTPLTFMPTLSPGGTPLWCISTVKIFPEQALETV
jgi:hypothetical protein